MVRVRRGTVTVRVRVVCKVRIIGLLPTSGGMMATRKSTRFNPLTLWYPPTATRRPRTEDAVGWGVRINGWGKDARSGGKDGRGHDRTVMAVSVGGVRVEGRSRRVLLLVVVMLLLRRRQLVRLLVLLLRTLQLRRVLLLLLLRMGVV